MIRLFFILLGLINLTQSQELPRNLRQDFFEKIHFVAVPEKPIIQDDPVPLSPVHFNVFAQKIIQKDLKESKDLSIWTWHFNNQEEPREEAYVWYHILKKNNGFTSNNLNYFAWAIKNADRNDIYNFVQDILKQDPLSKA